MPRIIPLKVECELYPHICDVDYDGFGSCGDGIYYDGNVLCPWVVKVLEYQEVDQPDKGKEINNG